MLNEPICGHAALTDEQWAQLPDLRTGAIPLTELPLFLLPAPREQMLALTPTSIETNADLQALLKQGGEPFIRFFLEPFEQKLYFHEVPAFHVDIFQSMITTEHEKSVYAVPRDHAKSTLAKLAAVYYFLYTDVSFILYVSNTASVAIAAVRDIIGFFECERSVLLYGKPDYIVEQLGIGYIRFRMPGLNKELILKAQGAGQQVRGTNINNRRPQLAIIDDLEDYDNTETPEQRKKLRKWFYGTFMKAMDAFGHKLIQLGNMVSSEGLLALHCHSPEWQSRLYGAILADGQPLWKAKFPLRKLLSDYTSYQRIGEGPTWLAEMMNIVIKNPLCIIDPKLITYDPPVQPLSGYRFGFLCVDPALGDGEEHDWSALVAYVLNDEGRWQLVEARRMKGLQPLDLFRESFALALKWGIRVWGIEAEAYQASLQSVFRFFAKVMGILDGTIEFVPLRTHKRTKTARLLAWAGMLKAKVNSLTEGDVLITQQLLNYKPNKKKNTDDAIDAGAYAPQMVGEYLHVINQFVIGEGANDATSHTIATLTDMQRSLYH